ncbi:hypothetical protein [Paratractidigestivibacter sp.]|uniref:hypothetical protein n=1 Tax=Paratractidigestivibacter sp. TaxID=2847316 RepID=UPI002ABE7A3E|nr:hypothetical protein [Paratractidigestivibacter sp.]
MEIESQIQIITTALTTILQVATIAVAIWTVRETQRAQPVVYLEHRRDLDVVAIVVKNFGNGVAYSIRLYGLGGRLVGDGVNDRIKNTFVETGIPMLVPGSSRDALLIIGAGETKNNEGLYADVTLEYTENGPFGIRRKRRETFVLDMRSFMRSVYSVSDEHKAAQSLAGIEKSLRKIVAARS